MTSHTVKVYPSKVELARADQFAHKIARMAAEKAPIDDTAREMVINRIIDNASVAIASVNRAPVAAARAMALAHPRANGATVFGADPALTVQLLEIASIGPLGELRRPVKSIRDALVLLGTQRLRSWVTLLMLRARRTAPTDELLTVLVRARTCELLAAPDDAAFAFTAGMVSAMDRFLGISATELARILPLGDEILQAAFAGVGAVGHLVQRVIRAESDGRADAAVQAATTPALDWALQSAELLESR